MSLLRLENRKERLDYRSIQSVLEDELLASSGQMLRESFASDYIARRTGISKEIVEKYFSKLENEGQVERKDGKLFF